MSTIHTLTLSPDWNLITNLSHIDRFGGSWAAIERREGQSLKQLKSIATVRSVGASTRIEGSKMTDAEVGILLNNLTVAKLEERDQQEVVGYFETLDIITESYRVIDISENSLKMLHNILLKHSDKDSWHRGDYKQHRNEVEATRADGTKYMIFKTAEPGFPTENAVHDLVNWYNSDSKTHPIVKVSLFVYDFLSIHPFQDGNGRLSRLLATLLMLKQGYTWIQYVSFEHEIESRKADYYKVLMQCQGQRPNEDVYAWTIFFLDCLISIQAYLMDKINAQGEESKISPRDKKIYVFIDAHPGSQSGEIAERLNIPLPTVKKILSEMVAKKILTKNGTGKGTNYMIQEKRKLERDLFFRLTDLDRIKTFRVDDPQSLIRITKLILTPLFKWEKAQDWGSRLIGQNLSFKIKAETNGDAKKELPLYSVTSMINPTYMHPIFKLQNPILLPDWERPLAANEYPVTISVEIFSKAPHFDFDIDFVYDAILE